MTVCMATGQRCALVPECSSACLGREPAGVRAITAQSVIEDREASHGDYSLQAEMAQTLKHAMQSSPNWDELPSTHRESLDMIAVKISRILNGAHSTPDHWLDLAGYATLIHNLLTKGTHL